MFLLKVRCVFPADHYLQPSTNSCKTPGQESSFLWLSAQPPPYIQNLLGMKKPSVNEIMFFLVALISLVPPLCNPSGYPPPQKLFWGDPHFTMTATGGRGVGITPAVSPAAGPSLSSSGTILHLPPYPKLQRNHRYLL